MQFLPVLPDSKEQLNQVKTYSPTESMAHTRDIYAWPSGWKDMRKSSGLPAVKMKEEDRKDTVTLQCDDQLDNSYPVLPVIPPDSPGDALDAKKRKLLKRQSKIYFGIGKLLPPLQEASLILTQEIQELAERTLFVSTVPRDDKSVSDNEKNPSGEGVKLSGVQNPSGVQKAPETSTEPTGKPRGGGYAVFHNGIYFEVHRNQSPSPSLDKHELKLSPECERHAQEDYIEKQLTSSQMLNTDNELICQRNSPSHRYSISLPKGKRVTFSPDIGRDMGETSKELSKHSSSKQNRLPSSDVIRFQDSDSENSNGEVREVPRTRSQQEAGRARTGQKIDNKGRLIASRDEKRDYSPSSKSPGNNSVQMTSQRKRSPWKKKFEDRLDQLNRRISENVQVSKSTNVTINSALSKNASSRVDNTVGVKQTISENVHAKSLISNNQVNEEGKVGNENPVLGDPTSTPCNRLDLRGASLHVAMLDENRSGVKRQVNRHIVSTSSHNGGGQKPSLRVAATATRRRDYVFQFSKTDSRMSTGSRLPRGGSLEEWSVEYLGVEKQHKSDNHVDSIPLPQTNTQQQKLLTLDENILTQTDTPLNMNSTYTLQRDVLPTPRMKSEVGTDFHLPEQNRDSDMPILLKVDSSKGYARTELSTLPMIGVKEEEQERTKKEPDKEKNRLYVGSTVQTSSKRKLSRKGDSLKKRFSKKKLLSSKSNSSKHKTGTLVKGGESVDILSSIDKSIPTILEVPALASDQDVETTASSSGLGWQSMETRDTPCSISSFLKVKHPNTARSSVVNGGDNCVMEVDKEEEDVLGNLIQVSQVNFSEKDKLRRQSRPILLKSDRKIQRSPRPRLSKSNSQPPLPPIGSKQGDGSRYGETTSRLGENGDRGEEEPKSRQEMRTGRVKPWMKQAPQNFSLPRLQADASMAMTSSLAMQAREDINRVVSEIEKMRWNQEQHEERVLTYGIRNFMSPRVVLISSRLPRCQSMRKAIRKDKNVIFIVYDFDTWSFDDILSAIRSRLDQYNKDCKMHSILFLCGGGVGFCYLLKNYVMTPQKLQRTDYAPMLEFWGKIGNMVSKLNPEEASISLMGCSLDADKQGKEVLAVVRKAVHPNIVRVESPSEHLAEGRKTLNQFFVYRRFLLWRTTNDDIVSKLGQGDLDRERTWSELAADADSDS